MNYNYVQCLLFYLYITLLNKILRLNKNGNHGNSQNEEMINLIID